MAIPTHKLCRVHVYYLLSYQDDPRYSLGLETSRYLAVILTTANVAARPSRSLCRSAVLLVHRPGAEAKTLPLEQRCYLTAHCSEKSQSVQNVLVTFIWGLGTVCSA